QLPLLDLSAGFGDVRDSAEPSLAPVGIDRAWTEPAPLAQVARARYAVQDHAVAPELDHHSGVLVDDLLDQILHAVDATAVRNHLPVERKPSVSAVLVERARDLPLRLHPHELARPELERVAR